MQEHGTIIHIQSVVELIGVNQIFKHVKLSSDLPSISSWFWIPRHSSMQCCAILRHSAVLLTQRCQCYQLVGKAGLPTDLISMAVLQG